MSTKSAEPCVTYCIQLETVNLRECACYQALRSCFSIQEVAENLTKELGAPRVFAEKVQSKMFDVHMRTAIGACIEGGGGLEQLMGRLR